MQFGVGFHISILHMTAEGLASLNSLVTDTYDVAKVLTLSFESNSYLTGVTTAKLCWHLLNMSVIFMIDWNVWLFFAFKIAILYILWWMPSHSIDDNSTLVQIMAWCHKVTSHYLNQCLLMPHGITRPQWVNITGLYGCADQFIWLSNIYMVHDCNTVYLLPF